MNELAADPTTALAERRRPQSGPSVGFRTLWTAVRRYPAATAITVVVAAVTAGLVWAFLPLSQMTGYATFHIAAAPQSVIAPVGSDRTDFNSYRQTQAALVKSRLVLNAALDKPEVAGLPMLQGRSDPITWLDSQLRVDFRQGPELMRITLEGDEPDQMTTLLTAITTAYLNDVVNKEGNRMREEKRRLERALASYTAELEAQQRGIRQYEEMIGAGDPTVIAVKQKIAEERLAMTQKQLFDIQTEIRELLVEIKTNEGIAKTGTMIVPEVLLQAAVRTDPNWQRLSNRRQELTDAIRVYRERVRPDAGPVPKLAEMEAELARVQAELDQLSTRVRTEATTASRQQQEAIDRAGIDSKKRRLEILKGFEDTLAKDAEEQLKKVRMIDRGQVDLADERQKTAEKQKIAQEISRRVEAIRVELDTPSRVELLEPPTAVQGLEGNRRLRYTALAAAVVLALGLGLNITRELRNPRVTDADGVEKSLGLKVVGSVPAIPATAAVWPLKSNDSDLAWQDALSESLSTARMVMLNQPSNKPVRSFLVSSAQSGEGKSSVALQFGVNLAQAGQRTLLIDGDLRRPQLHTRLGLPGTPGLAEVLRGEARVRDVLREVGLPGLTLLPAGCWSPAVTRALAAGRWKELIDRLAADYDVVVVDSTPILPVADGLAMARHVDGVVLSVLRDVSRLPDVKEARTRLVGVGANLLGVVLNGATQAAYRYSYRPNGEPEGVVPLAIVASHQA